MAFLGTVSIRRPPAGYRPQPMMRIALATVVLIILAWLAQPGPHGLFRWQPDTLEEKAAVETMRQALAFLAAERSQRGLKIDLRLDPAGTGLIGVEASPITTTLGNLPAKRTALQPEWAGILVHLLQSAGVQAGDVVAASFSGSFPSLNLAALAAAEALQVQIAAVSSLGASMWGANIPEWTWLDMEAALYEAGLVSQSSLAYTRGGNDDVAAGMLPTGIALLDEAAHRIGVSFLEPSNLTDAVQQRLDLYEAVAATSQAPITAYINVGGNEASLGRCQAVLHLQAGLQAAADIPPCEAEWEVPGVLSIMASRAIPIIHLLNIRDLALKHGLPVDAVPKSLRISL